MLLRKRDRDPAERDVHSDRKPETQAIVDLQRSAGNAAVARLLQRSLLLRNNGKKKEKEPEIRVGEAKPMPFAEDPMANLSQTGTQQMVPSGKDLELLAAMRNPSSDRYRRGWERLTPSQAWSLLAAEKRGELLEPDDIMRAVARLKDINAQFKSTYPTDGDAAVALVMQAGERLRRLPLATNFFLGATPGANREENKDKAPKKLADLLMEDRTGEFRNLWETAASQASADRNTRGAVEEFFGYATALGRGSGRYQDLMDRSSTFNPENKGEMPKYAALVSPYQPWGVAARYGNSVIYWKEPVRARVTHTPGDSWGNFGARFFTSNKHPAPLIALGDAHLVRLVLAEATDFAYDKPMKEKAESGVATETYFETQIHGSLTWSDVSHIVLNWGNFKDKTGKPIAGTSKKEAEALKAQLEDFAKRKKYDFLVLMGRQLE